MMKTHVSKDGTGKTLYLQANIYPVEGVDPQKVLYIACADEQTAFRFSTSPAGLRLLGERLLELYEQFIVERKPLLQEKTPEKKGSPESLFSEW